MFSQLMDNFCLIIYSLVKTIRENKKGTNLKEIYHKDNNTQKSSSKAQTKADLQVSNLQF